MIEYQFDQNGFYIGEAENPGTIPSHNCTFTAPMQTVGDIPWWNGEAWEPVENHTGEMGWLNGEETEIKEYGPLPDGWSVTPPPPTLEEAKEAKLKEINAAKWAEISNGAVEYEGLHYATDTDSQGLMGDATKMYTLAGILPPFWKAKDGLLQSPTIEQLTAIATAMYLFMEERFMKELTLAGQVQAAETVEEVQVIAWEI